MEARSPGGKSNVQRSRSLFVVFFCFVVVVRFSFLFLLLFLNRDSLCSSVLLGLKLLLPGLVQVNQSLVVEDKQNEVQRIRGDADDAEVL